MRHVHRTNESFLVHDLTAAGKGEGRVSFFFPFLPYCSKGATKIRITYSSQKSHVYRWACVLLLLLLALLRPFAAAAGDAAEIAVAVVASA
jgi:hypothetical protein